jgi:ribosomal protein L21E
MPEFEQGDPVRVDIPDETDPDHRLHGDHGEVIATIQDSAGQETGDSRDSRIYRVRLNSGETVDVRWRDLRPPLERR